MRKLPLLLASFSFLSAPHAKAIQRERLVVCDGICTVKVGDGFESLRTLAATQCVSLKPADVDLTPVKNDQTFQLRYKYARETSFADTFRAAAALATPSLSASFEYREEQRGKTSAYTEHLVLRTRVAASIQKPRNASVRSFPTADRKGKEAQKPQKAVSESERFIF